MNDGSIFGTGTEVLGTEADLEAWNQAIADRDSIARVLVSIRIPSGISPKRRSTLSSIHWRGFLLP